MPVRTHGQARRHTPLRAKRPRHARHRTSRTRTGRSLGASHVVVSSYRPPGRPPTWAWAAVAQQDLPTKQLRYDPATNLWVCGYHLLDDCHAPTCADQPWGLLGDVRLREFEAWAVATYEAIVASARPDECPVEVYDTYTPDQWATAMSSEPAGS